MTPAAREKLADLLAAARRERRQIADLPGELVPETPAEAYAVNALVAAKLGWPTLGWKIAGTNPQMQQRLRTGEPIYGRSFAAHAVSAAVGAGPVRVVHGGLLDPLVECELMFRLGSALPPRSQPYTEGEVAAAVASVHPGIEIAECRFPLASLPPIPAILADGAASGRYVVGEAIANWRTRDLAGLAITLEVDGVARRKGTGAEVMGDPIRALVWLANARRVWGDGLAAGELVSTGTCTGMLLARQGDAMRATFGDLPPIELMFV